jgi:anti-sigma factor RsiW
MKNLREIEQLSAYLDGQLEANESKRLESRLHSDPELASVLNDLRAARNILRKLPARKAPRNFTLTRQMVGLKPPLPRAYPIFRFATAFTTLLLLMTFALNLTALPLFAAPAAPDQFAYGRGGGGAGIEPAAPEPPAAEALELPAPTLEQQDSAAPEEQPSDATQTPKAAENGSGAGEQARAEKEAPVPLTWQIVLLVVTALGGLSLWIMRQVAASRWR